MGKYFSIEELCASKTAKAHGIDNAPNEQQKKALNDLIDNVLDPVRGLLGKPIWVNSGFRNDKVNQLAGGQPSSQHRLGEAADLDSHYNKELFELIRDHLEFDQLINEYNFKWVHVSYRKGRNRKQILKIG